MNHIIHTWKNTQSYVCLYSLIFVTTLDGRGDQLIIFFVSFQFTQTIFMYSKFSVTKSNWGRTSNNLYVTILLSEHHAQNQLLVEILLVILKSIGNILQCLVECKRNFCQLFDWSNQIDLLERISIWYKELSTPVLWALVGN